MLKMILTFIQGICIGMANVIPGVSGGTLAVVFNIYDKFVDIFEFKIKKLWKNRRFVLPLIIGMVLGVLLFSKLITILYGKYPTQTNFFFTGLVLGSIPMLYKYMTNKREGETKFKPAKIIGIAICALIGFALLVFLGQMEGVVTEPELNGVLPDQTLALTIRIFVAGIIGAVAMLMPGISGSLLMLMMGVYTIVMSSIPALVEGLFTGNFPLFFKALFLLLPNGVGVLLGLWGGAKLIGFLLKKFPNHSYAVIFGLICASAVNIFPVFKKGFAFESVTTGIVSIVCLLAGTAMAYFSSKLAPEENKSAEEKKSVEENEQTAETNNSKKEEQ